MSEATPPPPNSPSQKPKKPDLRNALSESQKQQLEGIFRRSLGDISDAEIEDYGAGASQAEQEGR